MVEIAIVDYGIGNLRSIKRGLEESNSKVIVTHEERKIKEADAVVLPGVGAFQEAFRNLNPLSNVILDKIRDGSILLGICLGLQLLFSTSTEGGLNKGLDFFKGKVIKLPPKVKVPHIGWNTLNIVDPNNPLFQGVPDGAYVYFVHSYFASPENVDVIISKTFYGLNFPSALAKKNVFLTQFHPEKSATTGLKILTNFVDYVKK